MKKPSLKEFDITAEQYAKYQDYKWKRDDRERKRDEFAHRFHEALISTIAIIFLILVLTVEKTVSFNSFSPVFSNRSFGSLFTLTVTVLIVLTPLFFLTRLIIGKLIRPKLKSSKIHRPFKRLYIKFQPSIRREPYFNNASKYELQNEAYYNYIGDLQQRFPDITEFNYDLQKYFKKIIDEIISYEYKKINTSIINHQIEKRRAVWLKMDGITFEREVANIYREHGYEAKTTKATGEGGVDIRLWKEGEYSIVQCKNVRRQIDEPAVKKLFETMHREKASKAILICSEGFTPKAKEFAKWKSIELLDLNQFLKLVNDIYPQEYQLVDAITETSVSNSNTTYKFKVIGKTDILYSTHSLSEETNYSLFETREDAKRVIRRLQRIEEMPLTSSASYDVEEWWLESTPSDYYRKALYYIKVSEKEMKATADKRDNKENKYGQRDLWAKEKYTQQNIWDSE